MDLNITELIIRFVAGAVAGVVIGWWFERRYRKRLDEVKAQYRRELQQSRDDYEKLFEAMLADEKDYSALRERFKESIDQLRGEVYGGRRSIAELVMRCSEMEGRAVRAETRARAAEASLRALIVEMEEGTDNSGPDMEDGDG